MVLELINGRRVTASGTEPNERVRVDAAGRVGALDGPVSGGGVIVDLSPSSLVYPGLVNAHDHLIGTFQPRVGAGPYRNWLHWDNDLKRSAVFRQRNMIDAAAIYRLGALKSILSGVTTVADHIPGKISEPHLSEMPVDVADARCLAHSVASFRLPWGEGPQVEYARANETGQPFMVHVGEGYDEETRGELRELDRMNALGPNTLLIHGVAFDDRDADLVAGRGASLAWCPGSNHFMFGATTDVRMLRRAGVNICLGTDSLFTGTSGLLDEMRLARTCYNERYGEDLSPRELFSMVTVNAARALHREGDVGAIAPGARGDLLCLDPGTGADPWEALVQARATDIRLLVCGGRPLLGLPGDRSFFEAAGQPFSQVALAVNGAAPVERLVAGDPAGLLDRIRARLGFRKELPFMRFPEPGRARTTG